MGKRIIQQARGHGGPRYRVRRKAFSIKPKYPSVLEGEAEAIKLVSSGGHTAPLAKFKFAGGIFFNFAPRGLYVGQKIKFNGNADGDISELGILNNGMSVFNIEARPKDGGKFIRSGGNSGTIIEKKENSVVVMLPSKTTKEFSKNCRATLGVSAGHGRLEKPILKAGKHFYIKKVKQKLWPRTSAVKMNIVDHPFGSGRGKRIKSKIAKRNVPPGAKVGLIRPDRTGRRKK